MKQLKRENRETLKRRKCLKKFLYYFKKGFADPKYISWERGYKEQAHKQFKKELGKAAFKRSIEEGKFEEIATAAIKIESRTNLLFSFEKMALRDAVKTTESAKLFSKGLYDYLYGKGNLKERFEKYVEVISSLPRKQTRVLTWPLVTVFGFLGNPREHIFLKPRVTKLAAENYGYPFNYKSTPNWETYKSLLDFADQIKKDTKGYDPVDYIDLQSFIWVMGSDEYPW